MYKYIEITGKAGSGKTETLKLLRDMLASEAVIHSGRDALKLLNAGELQELSVDYMFFDECVWSDIERFKSVLERRVQRLTAIVTVYFVVETP